MKGVLLAGGTGSRLYPTTLGVCKQLLPVYDKPMVYYSLSVLMLAGIREVLIITAPQDIGAFKRLLKDGSQFGLQLSYAVQDEPHGVAHALVVAHQFIGEQPVCLILGDNFFYGQGFSAMLHKAGRRSLGATVFAYPVNDVRFFGSVVVDGKGQAVSLAEKPAMSSPGLAVTGLYFLDAQAAGFAQCLAPSARGELEIMDVLGRYLEQGQLDVQCLGRGFAWLDMGTSDALLDAAHFVQTLEKRQGFKVACLEEIAWRQGWLDKAGLACQAQLLAGSLYGEYLGQLL